MSARRATLDEIEREITDRIASATAAANEGTEPFALGVACGAHDALYALRKWINDEMRSRDGADADSDGTLRRPLPAEGETRRREAAGE
jgi:hypothetical protein